MGYKFNPFTGTLDDVGSGGGGSTSPGGSDTQVQFNDGGVFGATSDLTFAKATGTLGVKYGLFASQVSAPSTPGSGFTLYANSTNALSWKGANGYVRVLDGTSNTADRTYTLPNASGNIALVAGSDTHIQFNDGGSTLGGSSDLTFNKTTKLLTTKGDLQLDDGGSFTTTIQCVTPTANRTISFPDATGTVGLVAGSSGQLVWNNAGAYAGVSTLTNDGSGNLTLSGRLTNTYASIADNPAKRWTGTWFTGGTSTTTKPHVLIEPTGTTSTAWSTAGTGLGVNAPSGFTGNLLDLQVNGSTRLSMGGGTASYIYGFNSQQFIGWTSNGSSFTVNHYGTTLTYNSVELVVGAGTIRCTGNNLQLSDTILLRDAADTLAQRRGTNAQTLRVYNTFTSATNYERAKLEWLSNVLLVGTEKGSGGGTARAMGLQTDGTTRVTIGAAGTTTFSVNGAVSAPPVSLTGTWFTGGTSTTTKPQLLIEPTGTTSTSWITDGTGLGVNAASAFIGNLIDAQVNGSSRFKVNAYGLVSTVSSTTFGLDGGFQLGSTGARYTIQRSDSTGELYFRGDQSGFVAFSFGTSTTEYLRINTSGNLQFAEGKNIEAGTTTGTKIGTATSQKLGFYNKTPIVQPTTAIAEAAFVVNSGGTAVNVDSTFGGYTLQQVVQALQNLGFLA